ncbi:MAG: hypothetical protein IPN29_01960 [Saprospiraceae bacterium]|nr:hypothetical protein [Saprospiraceae bacterium]
MTKKADLQERLEAVINEQETIYNRAAELENGQERGWTSDDEAKYGDLTKERAALLKKIAIENDKEEREALKTLNANRGQAPAVHTAVRTFSLERAFAAATTGDWDKNAGLEREVMQENARSGASGWDKHRMIVSPEMVMGTRPTLSQHWYCRRRWKPCWY